MGGQNSIDVLAGHEVIGKETVRENDAPGMDMESWNFVAVISPLFMVRRRQCDMPGFVPYKLLTETQTLL